MNDRTKSRFAPTRRNAMKLLGAAGAGLYVAHAGRRGARAATKPVEVRLFDNRLSFPGTGDP